MKQLESVNSSLHAITIENNRLKTENKHLIDKIEQSKLKHDRLDKQLTFEFDKLKETNSLESAQQTVDTETQQVVPHLIDDKLQSQLTNSVISDKNVTLNSVFSNSGKNDQTFSLSGVNGSNFDKTPEKFNSQSCEKMEFCPNQVPPSHGPARFSSQWFMYGQSQPNGQMQVFYSPYSPHWFGMVRGLQWYGMVPGPQWMVGQTNLGFGSVANSA